MVQRHRYNHDGLDQYFDRICMPKARRVYDVTQLSDGQKLAFLNLVDKHNLVKIPWENLTQHYSWHKVVNIKPRHLFAKIINNPGRGGYCMEANYFYHLILYSLGFDVHLSGSRVYRPPLQKFGGWTHVVNIVSIGGQRYLVDAGFGPTGPVGPIALEDGVALTGIEPAEVRVVYESIPNYVDKSQRVWIYQHRYNNDSPWVPMHCFTDMEFTPDDVETMNFEPWLDRHTFFTHKVVANRFTTEKELNGPDGPGSPNEVALDSKIDGALTMNHDTLKWRRHGEKVVDIHFKTDKERVDALRKYFGITLADEDREAIHNTAAMIGVKAMGNDD